MHPPRVIPNRPFGRLPRGRAHVLGLLCTAALLRPGLSFAFTPGPAAAADSFPEVSEMAREVMGISVTPYRKTPSFFLQDGRQRMIWFDFGLPGQPTPEAIALGEIARNPGFAWMGGMTRQKTRAGQPGPYLCDFIEGEDATFAVAVQPADAEYRVVVTLGDPEEARGPIDVIVNGVNVAPGVVTAAGEATDVGCEIVPEAGRVTVRLRARDCRSFAAVGLAVYGPKGATVGVLFPRNDPRSPVPPPDSLKTLGRSGTVRTLGRYCDYLLAHQPSDGGFSYSGAWYQNAYPVRTLLAGGRLLNEPRYREAALHCLDRFANAQVGSGGWISYYFGKEGCELSATSDTSSANLADIGTMSLCLALAVPHAGEERRARYLRAVTHYADSLVLPNQLDDGSFPNLKYAGRDFRHAYSVATATQAASLAALYAVTKDDRYLFAAERAGEWLANMFFEDGQVGFFPHDQNRQLMTASDAFGDLFYMVEGLTWVGHYSKNPDTRALIRQALDRYVWASQGIAARTVHGYWWAPASLWGSSKTGGMLYVLLQYRELGCRDPRLRKWIPRALAWLGDEGLAHRTGILAHPSSPTGEHAMVATGFAGISVAAFLDPNVLLPAPRDWRMTAARPR